MYTQQEINDQVDKVEKLKKEINRKVKEDRIELYNIGKIHHKQIEFHTDNHRIKALFGGNRTGKTVGGAAEAVFHALGYDRFRKITPSSGWVVSLTNDVQRDVAQKEILKWLPKKEIKDIIVRHGKKDDPENAILDKIILKNGQTIGFKTVEQGRESFQGTSQGWIWFDEEPPKEIYDECKMRVIDTCGYMWFTMTPLKGLTWIYNVIYLNESGNPDVIYWMMEWEDNPHLSKDEIAKLVADMTEEEREARQYGKFTSLCGFAFPMLRKEIHIKPIESVPDWYKRYVSIDYGLDATAVIWYWVNNYSKARIYRVLYKKNLIVSEAREEIIKFNGSDKIEAYYAPPDLWNRRNDTGKSAAQIFYNDGKGITLVRTSNDRESGWLNVREWLKVYETRDEQTGLTIKSSNLTFDEGIDPNLWRCLTGIQKAENNPNDVANTPHELTHLPDSLRCFCVSRMIVSSEPNKVQNDPFFNRDEDKGNNYFGGEVTTSYMNGGY